MVEDEWDLGPTLKEFGITDPKVLKALNEKLDRWAESWLMDQKSIRKGAFNEVLCHVMQLEIKHEFDRPKKIIKELIAGLEEAVKEEPEQEDTKDD
ncbi:hypothetical protein [Vibrio phage RYC]|nr:hypothetical protein [Vibrio phage RYC]